MTAPYAERLVTELACGQCASEVRVTLGSDPYLPYLARVIHTAGCTWYARHLAKEPGFTHGPVPCSTRVTHRGPYKRAPDQPAAPSALVPPDRPPVAKGVCQVPECTDPGPARLYPGGWLCDTHKPEPAVTPVPGWTPRSTS